MIRPSLTQLDLGRNKLTELDAAISEWPRLHLPPCRAEIAECARWNPVLTKAFLYENSLDGPSDALRETEDGTLFARAKVSLPELHLPLLTDLWVPSPNLL